jgi:YD repeat-containing protein
VPRPPRLPTPPVTSTGSCALYPIALSAQTLTGVAVSTTISSITHGTRPGNFGWLSWTGDTGDPALVASLAPPGDSTGYVNPADASDHTLAAGKSVFGRPGVANSSALRAALDQLKTRDITVPVWDTTRGSGSTATYHVSAFARVRLLDYQLPANKDLLSLRFLGYTDCGAAAGGAPTPTSTPGPLSSTRVLTYTYDGLQRLTDAVETPGTSYHYAYDLAGNRTDVVLQGDRGDSRPASSRFDKPRNRVVR